METEKDPREERVPSRDESERAMDEATNPDSPPVDGPGGETGDPDLGTSQGTPGEGGGTSGL